MYFSSTAIATFFAAAAGVASPVQAAHATDLRVPVNLDEGKSHQDKEVSISLAFKSEQAMNITPEQIGKVKGALVSSSKRLSYSREEDHDADQTVLLQRAVVSKASQRPLSSDLEKLSKQDLDVPAGEWHGYQFNYDLRTSCGCGLCETDKADSSHRNGCNCMLCNHDKESAQHGDGGCDCGHCKDQKIRGSSDCDCHHCSEVQGGGGDCGCGICSRFVSRGQKNAALLQWERQFCQALYYQAGQEYVFDCTIDIGCHYRNKAEDVDTEK